MVERHTEREAERQRWKSQKGPEWGWGWGVGAGAVTSCTCLTISFRLRTDARTEQRSSGSTVRCSRSLSLSPIPHSPFHPPLPLSLMSTGWYYRIGVGAYTGFVETNKSEIGPGNRHSTQKSVRPWTTLFHLNPHVTRDHLL